MKLCLQRKERRNRRKIWYFPSSFVELSNHQGLVIYVTPYLPWLLSGMAIHEMRKTMRNEWTKKG